MSNILDEILGSVTKLYENIPAKRGRSIPDTEGEVLSGYGFKQPRRADGRAFAYGECSNCGALGKIYHDEREGVRVCGECGAVKDRVFVEDEVRHLGEDKDGEKSADKTRTSCASDTWSDMDQIRSIADALAE